MSEDKEVDVEFDFEDDDSEPELSDEEERRRWAVCFAAELYKSCPQMKHNEVIKFAAECEEYILTGRAPGLQSVK